MIRNRDFVTTSAHRIRFAEDGQSLIGPLGFGATHMFVKPSTPVQNLDPSIQRTVSIADGHTILTIGRGTINGMEVHVGPFSSNLISCSVILQHGMTPELSLTDPYFVRETTEERLGEIQY